MDVAALGLGVDSSGLATADKALDSFASKADKAGGSADRFGASGSRSMAAIESMARQLDKITALLSSIDKAATAAAAGMERQGAAAAQAERMNATLGNTTTRLTFSYTQMGPAAAQAATAVTAQGSAAASAGKQVQQLDAHVQAYQAHLAKMARFTEPFDAHVVAFRNLKKPVDDVGKSLKFTAIEGLNFSRQMADIGVTAASGMNPLMIALQQGPQLFDILQQKAVMTGATVGTVAKAAGAQIYAALAPLLPIIAAVAAAAAAIAAGFALGAREINKSSGDIAAGLGLTEKQMERLKKAGVETSVTMSDTFFAFFDVVGERLTSAFDGPLKWLKDAWNTSMDFITDVGLTTIKAIVGLFAGAVGAIKAAWNLIPAALAEALTLAANAAIAGVEFMVNKTIDGINTLIKGVNLLGGDIDPIAAINLPRLENQFKGAGTSFGSALSKGFSEGLQAGAASVDSFFADVAKKAQERRRKAILDAAGDAAAANKPKGGKTQAELFSDLVGDITRNIEAIETQTKALELSEDAALAMTNQQKLLSDAQAKGIVLTEQQRAVLVGLAKDLTDAQIALRKAQNLKAANSAADDQIRSLQQAAEQVGVYGKSLAELAAYQGLLNKATNNGKDAIDELTDARLRGKAAQVAEAQAALDSAKFLDGLALSAEAAQRSLEAERGELGLGVASLAAYRMEQAALEDARQKNIALTSAEINAIHETAQNYGALVSQINAVPDAIAEMQANVDMLDLGSAFGAGGDAIQDMIRSMATLTEAQIKYNEAMANTNNSPEDLIKAEKAYTREKLAGTSKILGASKTFFNQQSAGYKIITTAEKVLAALQLVNAVKSMAMDTAKTASTVAAAGAQTAANTAAGGSKMFSQLGVFAFPMVAAMIAVMASLGFKGGSSSMARPPDPKDVQDAIGTGTVLGDNKAQSQSIANALDIIASNTNEDLEYSNDAVGYLRSIDSGINALTGQVGRQLGLAVGGTGMFSTTNLNLGSNGSNGFLGLFGSSTTRTLYDQGLSLFSQTVGDILQQGVQAQVYNVIEQVKKSSGFLGIGGGTKTTYQTITGQVQPQIEEQFGLIVKDITGSIVAFTRQLGIEYAGGIEQAMASATLPAVQLSFKDMSGDEIEKALQAYFSSVADMIANAVSTSEMRALQKAGEGLYETLARLTRTIMTVDTALKSINMPTLSTTYGNSIRALPAATELSDQFGGLDAFQEAVSGFADKFLSEAERMQPIMAAVGAEMARLGHSGVTTNEQFKALVQSQDLATEAGRAMFAQLLAVAPAFAKVNEYLAELNGTLGETGKTAEQLAQIAKDRRALEIQIMELEGRTQDALNAKRADALAALDESLRPLQQYAWSLQDQAAAAEAAAKAAADAAATERTRQSMQIELLTALGQSEAALTAQRALQREQLEASLRGLQDQIWAAQDLAAAREKEAEAARAAADLANARMSLEAQILELQGNSSGALAIQRQLELAAMDASLRPLQELFYQLTDAKAAADAAAQAQERLNAEQAEAAEQAARIAEQRRGLEIELMEALGNAEGAQNARRADAIATMDALTAALQQQVWAAQDAAAANAALAEAQARQAEIAKQRRGLEIELMRALGNESGATLAERADALAAMDETLRGLQQQVWAAQDAKAAAEAAAQAQAEAAREMAQAMEEARRRAEEIARQRFDLENRLYVLQGRGAEALARQREIELAAIDESNRALQLQIWAIEDAREAEERRTQAIADARGVLADAYNRESSALKDTIARFQAFGDSLREFRGTLYEGATGLQDQYRIAQALFVDTSSAARLGNADALSKLPQVAKEFLDASMNRAGSLADYQRDVARVAKSVDNAIGASDAAIDYAKLQLTALDKLVAGIDLGNKTEISTLEALNRLNALVAGGPRASDPALPTPVPAQGGDATQAITQGNADLQAEVNGLKAELQALREEIRTGFTSLKQDTGKIARVQENIEDRIEAREPFLVEVAP